MDEFIGHADVMSMYPSFIIGYGWIPRHLRKEFLQIYSNFYTNRITAKHSGQIIKSTALKLTLNSVTGKMQQETSWMWRSFKRIQDTYKWSINSTNASRSSVGIRL